jgi:quercetin dioxygenase-like cupin family protein
MPTDDGAPAPGRDGTWVGDIEIVNFRSLETVTQCHFTLPAEFRRVTAPQELARLAHVTFTDGAQTHWHHHTGPQWLVFLEGSGEVETRSGKRLPCGKGDVVRIDPCLSHRHGAAAGSAAAHLAITVGETEWEETCPGG